ncbi:MAG: biotin--[acetyl-CoA-carboxylase] ligase [candidate division Zixibacteria bacterium]|nr:biotin--[acetyl-CoA-carboxylase] ligase [candidate division Zixibacteria bacterium]
MPHDFTPLQIRLLSYLRQKSGSALSTEELAEILRVSPLTIAQSLEELSQEGYHFTRSDEGEIAGFAAPDRLLAHEIIAGLPTKVLGRQIYSFETITSTNVEAYSLALRDEPEGTLVVAEEQSGGKGRLGRDWHSPPRQGIYASLILRPQISPALAPGFSLVVAVNLVECISELLGIEAKIKWPNDVLIDGRKVAGILTELAAGADVVRFLIVGVGININQDIADFPAEIADKATSLKIVSGAPVNRVELLQKLLIKLEKRYLHFITDGLAAQLDTIKAHSSVLSRQIAFRRGGKSISGRAIDINGEGMLLVEVDGEVMTLAAGEITLEENY